MNIVEVYERFPTEHDCIDYLEAVKWKGSPTCPYCGSTNSSPLPKERRHHCNTCNTTYSVTVNTIFHKTKLPLQKWFLAIALVLNAKKGLSARQLSRDIKVNKDTAWSMSMKIRRAMIDDRDLLMGIVEMDETYIGGKPRRGGPRPVSGRGTKKIPVVGMIERGGRVRAMKVRDIKSKAMNSLVRGNVDLINSVIITDQYTGYARLKTFIDHKTVNHRIRYVDGEKHINTIESFWALLKRGIVGQYHKVSVRHLPKYIDEFCYRFNNRQNDGVFYDTLNRAIGGNHDGITPKGNLWIAR